MGSRTRVIAALIVTSFAALGARPSLAFEFGPDGLLYVTAVVGSGFEVLALDEAGVVHARYPGNVYVRGNISYGKLDVSSISTSPVRAG